MLLPTASFQQRKRMHPLLSTYNLNVENNMQLHKVLILFTVISMGCSSAIMINDALVNDAQVLPVAGRQGWMIKKLQ